MVLMKGKKDAVIAVYLPTHIKAEFLESLNEDAQAYLRRVVWQKIKRYRMSLRKK